MFRNGNDWLGNKKGKSKKHKTKKLESMYNFTSKNSKHLITNKPGRRHKHPKIGHINTVSEYVGPERLTKHVGFFTKGKISDSITRIEKIMPKEVKARVKQDLKEVLKLTRSRKNKKKIFSTVQEKISSKEQTFQRSLSSPHYLCHGTGFASSSWKDKLQKSVGLTSVNSILDSVNEPVPKSSVEEPQLVVRNLLLDRIHPAIKTMNNLLYPEISNKDKLKRKLQHIKKQFLCARVTSSNTSSVQESSHISQIVERNGSQSTIDEDFCLNPIFTGDTINECDVTKIFPSVNEIKCNNNPVRRIDITNFPNDSYDSEVISVQAPSSSFGKSSSVTLMPTSPTSSNDSPAWKLQISPVKFEPELGSTPTLYFRHKMF